MARNPASLARADLRVVRIVRRAWHNALAMPSADHETAARAELARFFRAAVAAVDPARLISRALDGGIAETAALPAAISAARRVIALAIGKGAVAMASALRSALGRSNRRRYRGDPRARRHSPLETIRRAARASIPFPADASEHSAHAALDLVGGLREDDLLIVALSGGASAMLSAPAPGLLLADKIAITEAMLRSGASIRELNLVRKHLSAIKGGRLAAAANPARVFGLILSDVPGNDIATIGSGLTAPIRPRLPTRCRC